METLVLAREDFNDKGEYIGEVDVSNFKGDIIINVLFPLVSFESLEARIIMSKTSIRTINYIEGTEELNCLGDIETTKGSIYGGNIRVSGYIHAKGSIIAYTVDAGSYIKAEREIWVYDGGIKAGSFIKCGRELSWGHQLLAGIALYTSDTPNTITVGKLVPTSKDAKVIYGVVEEIGLPDEQHL